jgi:DNA replication initiation complex subunit (GINS family)
MAEKLDTNAAVQQTEAKSINKMSIADVDAEFAKVEAGTKRLNESVKAAFEANQPVNVDDLRQLQKLTQRRTKLMLRRIALLVANPTSQATDLLDKLMKVKVAQA